MTITDPIADMLTRIRNAIQAKHEVVEVPVNKEKLEIARILKEEGFIADYTVSGDLKKVMTITLKYGRHNERVIYPLHQAFRFGLYHVSLSRYK